MFFNLNFFFTQECVNKTLSAVREAAPLLGHLGNATSALVANFEVRYLVIAFFDV
jgi:hypothetical protein